MVLFQYDVSRALHDTTMDSANEELTLTFSYLAAPFRLFSLVCFHTGLWGVGLIERTAPPSTFFWRSQIHEVGFGWCNAGRSMEVWNVNSCSKNKSGGWFAFQHLYITMYICYFDIVEWIWNDFIRCPPISYANADVFSSTYILLCLLSCRLQCSRTRTRSWLWWNTPAKASCMTTSASAGA